MDGAKSISPFTEVETPAIANVGLESNKAKIHSRQT